MRKMKGLELMRGFIIVVYLRFTSRSSYKSHLLLSVGRNTKNFEFHFLVGGQIYIS